MYGQGGPERKKEGMNQNVTTLSVYMLTVYIIINRVYLGSGSDILLAVASGN